MALTYQGSTAGSALANPPILLIDNYLHTDNTVFRGLRAWGYCSTNAGSDLTTPLAISDGYRLGMKVGDFFFGVTATAGSSSPIAYFGVVGLVTGPTGPADFGSSVSGASLSANIVTSTAA